MIKLCKLATGPRANGETCSDAGGARGVCGGGVCCTGCWTGTTCRLSAPAPCVDGDTCTLDHWCPASACSYATTDPDAFVGRVCQGSMGYAGYCDGTSPLRCTAGCYISNGKFAPDQLRAPGGCESCQPAVTVSAWTPLARGSSCGTFGSCDGTTCRDQTCFIGEVIYASGAANPANECEVCTPTASRTGWTALPDGSACAGGVCGAAACVPGGCFIGGIVRAPGSPNPSNACEHCNAANATTAWTPRADGFACGAGKVCVANGCVAGCWIDGAYRADGSLRPSEPCLACAAATATSAWTALPAGAACTSDGNPCTADACDGAGACLHPARANGTACGVGGTCSAGTCGCGGKTTETSCGDGVDDDCDGLVDCVDPDCAGLGCSDQNACTTGETCVSGACTGGTPTTCAAPPGPCFHALGGVCNPVTGVCAYTPLATDAACPDDGDSCTSDRCDGSGACVHPAVATAECGDPSIFGCGAIGGRGGGVLGLVAVGLLLALRRRRVFPALLVLGALTLPAAGLAEAPATTPRPARKATVAILSLKAGPGIDASTAEFVTASLTSTLSERTGLAILSMSEVQAALGFERQRQLLGCNDETSCLAEIGGALGVGLLVSGTLGRLGESRGMNLVLFNPRTGKVERRFSDRAADTSDEALLDLVGPGVDALFPPDVHPRPAGYRAGIAGRASRWSIVARGQLEARSPVAGAGVVMGQYAFARTLRFAVGPVVTGQRLGGAARLSWVPWNAGGRIFPVVAAEAMVLSADPVYPGGALSIGLEVALTRRLLLTLEVPAYLFPSVPAAKRDFYLFGAGGLAVRI